MYVFLLNYFSKTVADILIVAWYAALMALVYLFYTTDVADFKYIEL